MNFHNRDKIALHDQSTDARDDGDAWDGFDDWPAEQNMTDHEDDDLSESDAQDEDDVWDGFDDGPAERNLSPMTDLSNNGGGVNTEGASTLWDGNTHPAEYYIQAEDDFDEDAANAQDYSPTSTRQLDRIEAEWNRYVLHDRIGDTPS